MFQIGSEPPHGAKDAQLDGGYGDAEGVRDFFLRSLFDDGEQCGHSQFGRQPAESQRDAMANFRGKRRVGFPRRRHGNEDLVRRGRLRPLRAHPVQRGVGCDTPGPWLETACRIEACVGAVNAKERFDGQILGDAWIADDAENPAVYGALMTAEERLERGFVPGMELLQLLPGFQLRRADLGSACHRISRL